MDQKRKPKIALKIILIIAAVLLLIVTGFTIVSHAVYHRSDMATAAELLFRIQGSKKTFSDPDRCAEYIEARASADEYELTVRLKSDVSGTSVNGNRVYTLSKTASPDYTILYLHGGAYINDASPYHWKFCDKIVRKTNAQVIFPIYPLTPNHTWDETFELLTVIYEGILNSTDKPVIIMGDSAGGGLSVAFCEYADTLGLRQPDRMILLSPWMDISMSNPEAAEYEDVDPMLSAYGLVEMGKCWAGDLDLQDYRVSPIYGDISMLNNVFLFVGTREIFCPDVTKFHEMLKAQGSTTELCVGEGMNHVYPLYPIPEADDAIDRIAEILQQ